MLLFFFLALAAVAGAFPSPFRAFRPPWNITGTGFHGHTGPIQGHHRLNVTALHHHGAPPTHDAGCPAPSPSPNVTPRDISTFYGDPRALCSVFGAVTVHGERYGWLMALCSLDGAGGWQTNVDSEIDLSRCLGNYDNHLDWGENGGAFASCGNCRTRWMEANWLDCDCGSIDLYERIYIDANGAVSCFSQHGSHDAAPVRS